MEPEKRRIFGEIEEIEDEVEIRFNSFKNFDIITNPPHDHHYLPFSHYLPQKLLYGCKFRQRIEQEWITVEKNITNSTFIRAYEERIDLMTAAIIAPPNSPYQNCLFFFDIFFPMNYPYSPPKLHYRSYGFDLGPYLLPKDRIGVEAIIKWNPQECNILHVLHGIETLILGETVIPLKKRVFDLICQKIIRVLRKPLIGFEDLVAGHFRRRAHQILLKFKEENHNVRDDGDEDVINLFVSLYRMLEKNGAYCKHHLDFLRTRKQQDFFLSLDGY